MQRCVMPMLPTVNRGFRSSGRLSLLPAYALGETLSMHGLTTNVVVGKSGDLYHSYY